MTAAPMRVDYAAHPAFPEEVTPLDMPGEEVAAFDQEYVRLTTPRARAGSLDDWARLRTAASTVLDRLETQGCDDLQRLFLRELNRVLDAILTEQRDYYLSRNPGLDPGNGGDGAARLASQRFFVDQLPDHVTTELQTIAGPPLAEFRRRADQGLLSRADLSVGQGPVVRRLTRTLNAAFDSNGTLDAVSHYCGRSMAVAGLALELSDHRSTWWQHKLPTEVEPRTMYAHLDETISVPKAIVYLSDVARGMGETSCYPGLLEEMRLRPLQDLLGRAVSVVMESPSALPAALGDSVYHQALGSAGLRRLFMSLPEELRFNSHLGWDVMPGSGLESHMVAIEEPLLGPAGRHIVFDGGRLFHRGGLIERGQRAALQVIFRSRSETRFTAKVGRRLGRLRAGGS